MGGGVKLDTRLVHRCITMSSQIDEYFTDHNFTSTTAIYFMIIASCARSFRRIRKVPFTEALAHTIAKLFCLTAPTDLSVLLPNPQLGSSLAHVYVAEEFVRYFDGHPCCRPIPLLRCILLALDPRSFDWGPGRWDQF